MSLAESLAVYLAKLFLDQDSNDIVFECKGVQIPAHASILGARSPVFKVMFKSKMSESINKEVKIDDVEPDVLKEMLRFMYSAKVDESFTKFRELLVVADKYQVVELVELCGTKIVESLNKDNVLDVGAFAEFHNADKLMKACVEFILNNPGRITI